MLPLTFVCRSLCGRMFSFLWGIYLGVGLLGHMVTSFDHLRNAGLLYQLHFCQQRRRVPLSPRACRTVDVVPLFDCSPPNRCRVALHCSFDFHFLDGWGGEHLFMCFLATCVYFLRFIFIREREMWGKGDRETRLAAFCTRSNRGPSPQPRHVPWPGIQPATFWLLDNASTNWATLARAVHIFWIPIQVLCPFFNWLIF